MDIDRNRIALRFDLFTGDHKLQANRHSNNHAVAAAAFPRPK